MRAWQKILAVILAIWLPIVSGQTKSIADPIQTRQLVSDLGVGADVKVKLESGKKYRGLIQAIQEEGFELALTQDQMPQSLSYDQIAELKLAAVYYKTKTKPDPVEARRTVVGLGVGKHVMARNGRGIEVHGNIQEINADYFTVLADHQQVPLKIAYTDTWQVEPNLSRTAKILIGVGVAVGVFAFLVIWAVATSD
jgi:ribosome maturation factor RimP